jgi:hypothetical protein
MTGFAAATDRASDWYRCLGFARFLAVAAEPGEADSLASFSSCSLGV